MDTLVWAFTLLLCTCSLILFAWDDFLAPLWHNRNTNFQWLAYRWHVATMSREHLNAMYVEFYSIRAQHDNYDIQLDREISNLRATSILNPKVLANRQQRSTQEYFDNLTNTITLLAAILCYKTATPS